MRILIRAALFSLLLLPSASLAEGVRLNLTGGFGFGGSVYDPNSRTEIDFDEGATYGASLSIPLNQGAFVEILARRQESGVRHTGGFQPVLFDLDIDLYQVGGLFEFDSGTVRPFLSGTLGVTRYLPEPSQYSSETRFSMTLGGGVNIFPSRHFGIRFEGRGLMTFVGSSGGGAWCGPGGCWVWADSEVLWQGEILGGVVLSF